MLEAEAIITLGAGRYRLRERLGGSAYGVVWRALGPHGEVALKLVNAEQMARAHPGQRERWTGSARKEISFLRSLSPWDEGHIVRLLDSGEHEGLPVMALELMAGDLAAHVAAHKRAGRAIPLARILGWLAQLNQALAKVHQYGWRYLDLKSANVLLSAADGSARLADFGTTQRLGEAQAEGYAGTASWQAPEQFFPDADGNYDTDARSDYFALGALFYYLVTGGLLLRFCSTCGDAYRQYQGAGAGAAALLALHGAIPATLHASEEALFLRHLGQGDGAVDDATWHPGSRPDGVDSDSTAAARANAGASVDTSAAALALLRALLATDRGARPASALQISRMLGAIRPARTGAMRVTAPTTAPATAPAPSKSWPRAAAFGAHP